MTHAFLITAYKDEMQLCSLVNQLLKYDSLIYIHIDRKSATLHKNLIRIYSDNSRIKVLSDSEKVYWGGYSHLKSILKLIAEAYKNPANARCHLLSGQDLPIRSKKEFDLFFKTNADKEYITCFKLPDPQWANGGLDRLHYYHLNDVLNPKKYFYPRINGRLLRFQKWLGIKRKQPDYISNYYGGGTWWSLSRKAIAEIIDFQKRHPDFISHFKNTYCGEELFFQTILSNSDLKDSIMPEDLRYIDWNVADGKFPPVLDESYLKKILASKKLFARKFDSGTPKKLRERIERGLDVE